MPKNSLYGSFFKNYYDYWPDIRVLAWSNQVNCIIVPGLGFICIMHYRRAEIPPYSDVSGFMPNGKAYI